MGKCNGLFLTENLQTTNVIKTISLIILLFLNPRNIVCDAFLFSRRHLGRNHFCSSFDHKLPQNICIYQSSQSGPDTQTESNEALSPSHESLLTSAVLKISYDGAHFYGWSAANDGQRIEELANDDEEYSSRPNGASFLPPLPHQAKGRRSRKRKGSIIRNIHVVRSVEGTLKTILAKIYGNVETDRIVLEGSSRTDKGVHAHGMIALAYCLKPDYTENHNPKESTFQDKKKPHPSTPSDTSCFEPLPFNSDLPKLMFVLNRMLPPDLRVMAVSSMPTSTNTMLPAFHPSCHSIGKTYIYTFTVNKMHDPLRWRHVWHVEENAKLKSSFDVEQAQAVANLFAGTHDFSAFRGAFKSKTDKAKKTSQNTICTINNIQMEAEDDLDSPNVDLVQRPQPHFMVGFKTENFDENHTAESSLPQNGTFQITITGDRFLYKMVRFMVGTIVAVGLNRVSEDEVKSALQNGSWCSSLDKDEKASTGNYKNNNIFCAPSHGLVLEQVYYLDDLQFDWKYG